MKMAYKRRRWAPAVVAQGSIASYLGRELDSWDWIKQLPAKELGLNGFRFSATYEPFLHQQQCFVIGQELPQFCFFLDMGAGKTLLTLALHRWHKVKATLVCVPKEVNIQSWLDEIALHAPELKALTLLGDTSTRRKLVKEQADIYLINYPGLQYLMSDLVRIGKGKKRKRQIVPDLAIGLAQRFGMVVFDESHKLGNSQSLTYRECRYFTKYCRYRYALTGTPFGRDPMLLWSQFHVVDDGATFGQSLGLFRSAFFHAKEAFWGGVEYEFDKRMEPELHRIMKHRSIYYRDTEFRELPPMVKRPVRLTFATSAQEQYRNVVKRIKESKGSAQELESAFVRMRMCTSGFLSMKDAADPKQRLTMYFEENPKLEALEEMIEGIPPESKAIVFHEFILSGKMITEMLKRNKYRYAELAGHVADPMGQMRSFLHDPKVRFLVANNESGSTGINPQHVCNYAIFFESPVSPITRKQAEKRLQREGQSKRVYIFDLLIKDSIDEKIAAYLKEGKDLFDAILRGEEKL